MNIICPDCEQKNDENAQVCSACGRKLESTSNSMFDKKFYSKLSLTSYVISLLTLSFFSWFPVLLVTHVFPYFERSQAMFVLIIFTIIILIGIIFGAISIKKANLVISFLGLFVNSCGLVGMIIYFVFLPK